mmetsp:Transcript_9583/g.24413  ORF Transcript_9583/g.24413 Transcript_9583/m.24413 type:complete len:239 (-) Transcript_9583:122-838(-)
MLLKFVLQVLYTCHYTRKPEVMILNMHRYTLWGGIECTRLVRGMELGWLMAVLAVAAGKYDPKKLFGVTTLDVVRANKFVSEILGVNPKLVSVPVVGGHAGVTILPLLSQTSPPVLPKLTPDAAAALTTRIQNAGTEVVEAKAGGGSATLSMAYAAARFAESCMSAMAGAKGVEEYSYVESTVVEGLPFFSSKVSLGPGGIEAVAGLEGLNEAEAAGLEALKQELAGSIAKGVEFVNK